MSFRSQQPRSRRTRRQSARPNPVDNTKFELPGPIRIMMNRKVLIGLGVVMASGLMLGLLPGVIGLGGSSPHSSPRQANELADEPRDLEAVADASEGTETADGTQTEAPTAPIQSVRRFEEAPVLTIDPSKRYVATIKTDRGDIELDLFVGDALQTVNSFVFLAREGYYNENPVILTKNRGASFAANLGDPTGTGSVRPGYTTPRETNDHPFVRGAVGMGDSQTLDNDGRFWVSFADAPTLNGKYTIFGQVRVGIDVLEALARGGAKIVSVTVEEL